MENGKYIDTEKGTPQGNGASPILANIYLHHVLDLWFETAVKLSTFWALHSIVAKQTKRDSSDVV